MAHQSHRPNEVFAHSKAASRACMAIITVDVYEVERCHRGRGEQQEAHFVVAPDVKQAACIA